MTQDRVSVVLCVILVLLAAMTGGHSTRQGLAPSQVVNQHNSVRPRDYDSAGHRQRYTEDVCIATPPRLVPSKAGGRHIINSECRLSEYWSVLNGKFVAKTEYKYVYYVDSISHGKVYVTYADSVPVAKCHYCKEGK